jgi:chromosomal replication initiator protein
MDSILNSALFTLPLSSLDRQISAAVGSRCASEQAGEAFIAGAENALVRVLAAAIISQPLTYNPIVLCGPTGVGKSSVAHTLAAHRKAALGLKNVIALSAIDAARELAHALETSSEDDLRNRYQGCDLLFIDDIDRLTDRPAAQRLLLAAGDVLLKRGALMLVTMRRPPLATPGLLNRLTSRLTGGLVVELAPPGTDARVELARRIATKHALRLSDQEISRIAGTRGGLADRVLTAPKIREAVLKRAARAIENLDAEQHEGETVVDCRQLCRLASTVVARHYGLPAAELKRPTRRKTVAEARALAMYLVRTVAGASYAAIGKSFGGRDHTTVLHACRKTAAAVESDAVLRRLVDDFALQLASAGGR